MSVTRSNVKTLQRLGFLLGWAHVEAHKGDLFNSCVDCVAKAARVGAFDGAVTEDVVETSAEVRKE